MSIERKPNGFYEDEAEDRLGIPASVGIESGRVDACMEHYNKGRFRGLFGNPRFGFREETLDFLHMAKTKPVRLWFWDIALKNVDALYEIEELSSFGIHPKRPGIDFSRFRRITWVVNVWNKHDSGLARATISKYDLWHFKPRSKSFSDVEIPITAERLDLTWANPVSLEGLPVMPLLKELQIHRCRNLSDLSALPRIAPNLQTLIATTSSRLIPEAGVLDHPKLKTARINGNVLVGRAD